ncbi:MAG: UDP-N-acetylmuramoyl-L-alanine--D-glutamate ligase [Vicinamibacteraceae bacterium]
MTTTSTFSVSGQRVVVVGAARSGVAAAHLLAARGASVVLTDTRETIEPADELRRAGVVLELGGHRPETLSGADLIVLSPGVSPRQADVAAARAAGVPVIGEVELASRWLVGRIVAVTGTKGKSTTTTLIGRMLEAGGLKASVGGNIGVPLSTQVAASAPDVIHVVEASSFQLETTEQFRPWIAVLLNLSADHLDRHASLEEYAAAKGRIFANQQADDYAIVNVDDLPSRALARTQARFLPLSPSAAIADGIVVTADMIAHRRGNVDTPLVPVSAVRLLGRHLLTDVAAAAAVAEIAGVAPDAMVRAVEGFTGLEHALERVSSIQGVAFVNDSKATNIESAARAIESIDEGLVVILGGRFKGGDFAALRAPLVARQATVVTIGEASPLIAAALTSSVPVRLAASMDEAVRIGFASAPPGGTVLLAPACASFDMFADYAERGRRFKDAVARLAFEVKDVREQ